MPSSASTKSSTHPSSRVVDDVEVVLDVVAVEDEVVLPIEVDEEEVDEEVAAKDVELDSDPLVPHPASTIATITAKRVGNFKWESLRAV